MKRHRVKTNVSRKCCSGKIQLCLQLALKWQPTKAKTIVEGFTMKALMRYESMMMDGKLRLKRVLLARSFLELTAT